MHEMKQILRSFSPAVMNNLVMLRPASFVNLTFQHARFCHVLSFLYKEHKQREKGKD